jgi:hypothetical protein
MWKYIFRNNLYTIQFCEDKDIPSHIERVSLYWNPEEIEVQRQRMLEAVSKKTAYKVVRDDNSTVTFLYYDKVTRDYINGIAVWWLNLRSFFILGHYLRFYWGIRNACIVPHKANIVPFTCLVEDMYIERYRKTGKPLIIDLWSPKCEKIRMMMEKLDMRVLE